jgi:hypothetical protein
VLAVVVTAVILAGCTDDPEADTDGTERTTKPEPEPTTTEDPNEAIKREISDAYDRWHTAERKLFEAPDPESPLIEQTYVDPLRSETVRNLQDAKDKGLTAPPRPGDVSKWAVTSIEIQSPTEVVLSDCYVNGGWTLDAAGQVVDDRVGTYEGTVRFIKGEDGDWRAADLTVTSRQEGVSGCAERFS